MVMKRLFYFLFVLLPVLLYNSFSQESNWFTDITVETGLEGIGTSKIQCVDINNDNYPDLLLGTGGLTVGNSNTFYIYLNVPDPGSPNKRKFIDYTEESGINVTVILKNLIANTMLQ